MKHVWLIPLVLLAAREAAAYPEMIGKGYTTCATCHYSPTGGGFVNSYGFHSQEVFLGDDVDVGWVTKAREGLFKKPDITGYDENGHEQFQLGLDLDSRLMIATVSTDEDAKSSFAFIPMLFEVGGVAAWGKFLFYGSIGGKEPEADGIGWKTVSREHWLQFKATETLSVRAGRMVLPFGLRIPDHTAYTRSDLKFGFYDQNYGVEADYVSERLVASVAGFIGNYVEDPKGLRDRGAAGSATLNIDNRAAIGVSALYAGNEFTKREAVAAFARVKLIGASYVLAEVDGQNRSIDDLGSSEKNLATLVRVGWWARESLNVFIEHGYRIQEHASDGQARYIAGANWWLLPWVELAPMVRLETHPGTSSYTAGLLQAHIYY